MDIMPIICILPSNTRSLSQLLQILLFLSIGTGLEGSALAFAFSFKNLSHLTTIIKQQSCRVGFGYAHFAAKSSKTAAYAETEMDHDTGKLEQLVMASSLCYLPINGNTDSTQKSMTDSPYFIKSKLEPLIQIEDPTSLAGATIFRSNIPDGSIQHGNTTTIIVACRGSANINNFFTNLRFQLVSVQPELLMKQDKNNSNGIDTSSLLIHTGFQQAGISLWQSELSKALQGILEEYRDMNIRLIFSGHSLGAATALLSAVQYSITSSQDNGNISHIKPSIITFGGPQIVTQSLADYWNQKFFDSTTTDDACTTGVINYIHSKDPILQQNRPLWDALGFGIVGKQVLCEPYKSIIYPTVETLDQSVVAWNFWDHCQYFGIFVGPRLVSWR